MDLTIRFHYLCATYATDAHLPYYVISQTFTSIIVGRLLL